MLQLFRRQILRGLLLTIEGFEFFIRWPYAAQAGAALEKACMRKVRETAEVCQREGIVFLPFALETLGGLHKGAITQVKLIATALARCKGVNEGEATGQLFGRLSLILMKANSLMLSTRCQDADFPSPAIDGIE